jgi:hypothetical protein
VRCLQDTRVVASMIEQFVSVKSPQGESRKELAARCLTAVSCPTKEGATSAFGRSRAPSEFLAAERAGEADVAGHGGSSMR